MTQQASLQTDGYKLFHKAAYHPDIDSVYSNFTSRNGRLSNVKDNDSVVFVGLQYFIKDVLIKEWNETFFNVEKDIAIKQMKRVIDAYLNVNYNMTHFEELHDLGYLPIKIKALPEGVSVPYGVPPVTFSSTVKGFQWLANYLETVMSTENWPIQTSATTAKAYLKNTIASYVRTGLDVDNAKFAIHDFSFRGCFGRHAAAMSGFGHLCVGNTGTDTIPAIMFAEDYYNADVEKELVGCSVAATEHSTTTSYIQKLVKEYDISPFEAELEYVRYLMDLVPEGIVSHVSDSYDFWKFVSEGLPILKNEIIRRDGTLVVRPDSGDPVDVLCGTNSNFKTVCDGYNSFEEWKKYVAEDMNDLFCRDLDAENPHSSEMHTFTSEFGVFEVEYKPELNRHDKTYYYVDNWYDDVTYCTFTEIETTPEQKGLIECLWDTFEGTITDKGYKLLDSHIGAIYGDSITLERQKEIIKRLEAKGFAPNVVLGVGSYSYQYVTRDTHGSAVKATWVGDNSSEGVDVFKDPKTDSKKKSAKGLLRVELENGKYVLHDQQTPHQETLGELKTVFENGKLISETSLAEIRERVMKDIMESVNK